MYSGNDFRLTFEPSAHPVPGDRRFQVTLSRCTGEAGYLQRSTGPYVLKAEWLIRIRDAKRDQKAKDAATLGSDIWLALPSSIRDELEAYANTDVVQPGIWMSLYEDRNETLRLQIVSDRLEIQDLPWEALRFGTSLPVITRRWSLVRRLGTASIPGLPQPLGANTLRVLLLVGSQRHEPDSIIEPNALPGLLHALLAIPAVAISVAAPAAVLSELQQTLGGVGSGPDIAWVPILSPVDITRALQNAHHVVHCVGHSDAKDGPATGIQFDLGGVPTLLNWTAFTDALHAETRMVVLTVCWADIEAASAILTKVPHLIATSAKIPVTTATIFSEALYAPLQQQRRSVPLGVGAGRAALALPPSKWIDFAWMPCHWAATDESQLFKESPLGADTTRAPQSHEHLGNRGMPRLSSFVVPGRPGHLFWRQIVPTQGPPLNPFWITAITITLAQFREFEASHKQQWKDDAHPATVSWSKAEAFAHWMNAYRRNLFAAADVRSGYEVRLPSVAEWMCAVGLGSRFAFGDNPADLHHYAVFGRNREAGPAHVATKAPTRNGLFDVHGNVHEWCSDAREGNQRVAKGGAYFCRADVCELRPEHLAAEGGHTLDSIGFRLVLAQRVSG